MMEYKGYIAHIKFDDEVRIFHGEVVNIRDVITFQGQSVNELYQAFQDSVNDYLSFCAERHEEPDAPFSGRFLVQLPPEQYRKVIFAAEKVGKGVDSWITDIIAQAVSA